MAPAMERTVTVIGSLNIDFVTRTSRLPEAGETLAALSFDTGFGGKGANQAVAAARLASNGVSVKMTGQVGNDAFGAEYLEALTQEGIDERGVRKLQDYKTGITNIVVEEKTGENRIMFVANANSAYSEQYDDLWNLVEPNGKLVVFQLEIPLRVVLFNIREARQRGQHVLLNPAPAVALPESAFADIDTLIMNESESRILAGLPDLKIDQSNENIVDLAVQFLAKGVKDIVIITLGGDGVVYATSSGLRGHLPAYKAEVVDTTAAGDTFVGAYAVRRVSDLTESFNYTEALQFAAFAASKTVEKEGAMSAIPYRKQLQADLT